MPNKYAEKKCGQLLKQGYKLSKWSDYNAALCARSRVEFLISEEAIKKWC